MKDQATEVGGRPETAFPAHSEVGDLGDQQDWLLCRSQAHLFGLPLSHVSEIMRVLPINAVFGAPPYVRGLCVIRGAWSSRTSFSNAIKFSPHDAEVVVMIEDATKDLRISVRDHGPGSPAEYRDRIFERFVQVDATDARAKGGTGFGLAIAK